MDISPSIITRCPVCGTPFGAGAENLLGKRGATTLIRRVCSSCGNTFVSNIAVSQEGIREVTLRTGVHTQTNGI
ncbi:MAG: hypothetical protein HY459_01975 [Parcubacteria group bacterium]|nr:hypothetical protein [Parcubacteria group bacterium]